MRYVWLVEGEPYAGSLDDYAKDLEQAHYSGVDVSNTIAHAVKVFTFGAEGSELGITWVTPKFEANVYDDIRTVYISVGQDEARYKIDLRT